MLQSPLDFFSLFIFLLQILEVESSLGLLHDRPCQTHRDCNTPYATCNKVYGSHEGLCYCISGFSAENETCVRNTVHKSKVGQTCQNSLECSAVDPNSICTKPPQTCHSKVQFCSCRPGFVYENKRCIKKAGYGEFCDNIAVFCGDSRTACDAQIQRCVCDSESKPHPRFPTTCTSRFSFSDIGGNCRLDKDCYDGFRCSSERTCACPKGSKFNFRTALCQKNELGSECYEESDCSQIKHSLCSIKTNTCKCKDGFQEVLIGDSQWVNETTNRRVCISKNQHLKKHGEICDEEGEEFCMQGFSCLNCRPIGSKRKVCTDLVLERMVQPNQIFQLDDDCDSSDDCSVSFKKHKSFTLF